MATLMDLIMQEYQTMPAGSPDYSLGSRRTMMQPGGQFNDAGRLGHMGMRQTLSSQAPAGSSPITPGMPAALGFRRPISEILASRDERTVAPMFQGALPEIIASRDERTIAPRATSPFDETNMAAPQFIPERRSPFDETNMPAPVFAPATVAQGMTNVPLPPRIPGGQTRGVREPGFFERIFGGTQFQSNNMPVTIPLPLLGANTPEYINWGDPNRAADFFAADRALMQQNPAMFGLLGGTNG